jgi:hypothetical protein
LEEKRRRRLQPIPDRMDPLHLVFVSEDL